MSFLSPLKSEFMAVISVLQQTVAEQSM